ncbi:acetylglutamate kinase [Tissierella creatinini]|nr:acetylglutamate kinase [Tissierella creatinini]TJX63779.1 acetylglutamate kinase [Soehngenia saccharolytica]
MLEQIICNMKDVLDNVENFKGKTLVIKFGGSIMSNEECKNAFYEDIAFLNNKGIRMVIVHGGGPSITSFLQRLNIEAKFINGLRFTDGATMEVVEFTLSGKVNKEISGKLYLHGVKAIGLSGRDCGLVKAEKIYTYNGDERLDIGFVGKPTHINISLLEDLLNMGYIPVIAPIGTDDDGNVYNINADHVVSAVSSAIKADKLVLLTDVEGVYLDLKDKDSLIKSITVSEMKDYIKNGIISGGMIPKMEGCIDAIEKGTKNVQLIDGRKIHSLITDVFGKNSNSTIIKGVIEE